MTPDVPVVADPRAVLEAAQQALNAERERHQAVLTEHEAQLAAAQAQVAVLEAQERRERELAAERADVVARYEDAQALLTQAGEQCARGIEAEQARQRVLAAITEADATLTDARREAAEAEQGGELNRLLGARSLATELEATIARLQEVAADHRARSDGHASRAQQQAGQAHEAGRMALVFRHQLGDEHGDEALAELDALQVQWSAAWDQEQRRHGELNVLRHGPPPPPPDPAAQMQQLRDQEARAQAIRSKMYPAGVALRDRLR